MSALVIATSVRAAIPVTASVSMGYSESIRMLSHRMPVSIVPPCITYSCDNIRARNRIVGLVLREEAFRGMQSLLFWDDDQWPQDVGIVGEMMALGLDVVSAPYTNKKDPVRWNHILLPGAVEANNVVEVRAVGMGFTLISRGCLEKMSAAHRRYTDRPNPHKLSNIFGQLYDQQIESDDPEDESLLSEDFSFCKRAREMGIKVHLYTRSGIIWHAGGYPWSGLDIPGGMT